MKYTTAKYLSLSALFALSCASAGAATRTVVDSASTLDWSDTSTWTGGVLPTNADTVEFAGSTTNMNVDADAVLKNFNIGAGKTVNINIESGYTLALPDSSGSGFTGASFETSKIYFTGEGTTSGGMKSVGNVSIYYMLDSAKAASYSNPVQIASFGNVSFSNPTYIYIEGHYKGGRVNGTNAVTFEIADNSSYTVNSAHWNFWHASARMIIGSNSTLNNTKGGFVNFIPSSTSGTSELISSGAIICSGTAIADTQVYSLAWRTATFNAGATIKETGSYGTYIDGRGNTDETGGLTTINAGVAAGALQLSYVYIGHNEKFALNASDTFKIGGNNQIDSEFFLATKNMKSSVVQNYAAADLTIDNNADNNFGKFTFWTGSTLRLQLDDTAKLLIKDMALLSDSVGTATGTMKVIVENLGQETFFIGADISDKITSGDVAMYASDGTTQLVKDVDYTLSDLTTYNDVSGYWFNSVIVPEPAEWAALLGALALAFAAYRRRR